MLCFEVGSADSVGGRLCRGEGGGADDEEGGHESEDETVHGGRILEKILVLFLSKVVNWDLFVQLKEHPAHFSAY